MKQVIILFGQPGAGKGTQAELLSDKLVLYHFETSKILETNFKRVNEQERFVNVNEEKYDMVEEKKKWDRGELNSPPFVAFLVKEKINELAQAGKSFVLSGSPRTLFEAEEIIPILKELYGLDNISAFFIDISEKETIFRNSHRKICQLIRHPVLYNQETEKLTLCPLDGSELIKRELDDPETIKVRLKTYKERTFPVIDYLKKKEIKITEINGEQSVSDVFKDILKEVE